METLVVMVVQTTAEAQTVWVAVVAVQVLLVIVLPGVETQVMVVLVYNTALLVVLHTTAVVVAEPQRSRSSRRRLHRLPVRKP